MTGRVLTVASDEGARGNPTLTFRFHFEFARLDLGIFIRPVNEVKLICHH